MAEIFRAKSCHTRNILSDKTCRLDTLHALLTMTTDKQTIDDTSYKRFDLTVGQKSGKVYCLRFENACELSKVG